MDTKYEKIQKILHLFFRRHQSCFLREHEKNGLSELSNPHILYILFHKPPNITITQKKIADIIGITPPTVAISIKRMEKAGIVKKIQSEDDLRENCVELTEKGIMMTEKLKTTAKNTYKSIFADFEDEEIEMFLRLLSRLIQNMDTMCFKSSVELEKEKIND